MLGGGSAPRGAARRWRCRWSTPPAGLSPPRPARAARTLRKEVLTRETDETHRSHRIKQRHRIVGAGRLGGGGSGDSGGRGGDRGGNRGRPDRGPLRPAAGFGRHSFRWNRLRLPRCLGLHSRRPRRLPSPRGLLVLGLEGLLRARHHETGQKLRGARPACGHRARKWSSASSTRGSPASSASPPSCA